MDGSSLRWYSSTPTLLGTLDENGIVIMPTSVYVGARAYSFSSAAGSAGASTR